MAGKQPEFEFLGYKKTPGFQPLAQLGAEDFYQSEQPNPKADRIVGAVIDALLRPEGRKAGNSVGKIQKDRPEGG